MSKQLLVLLAFAFWGLCLAAQPALRITLLQDKGPREAGQLAAAIKTEAEAVLSGSRSLAVTTLPTEAGQIAAQVEQAYGETDILVGIGLSVCSHLAGLRDYPKPTILAFVLDNELQGIPLSDENSSGVDNLTYVQSPLSLSRGLEALYEIIPYRKLAVLIDEDAVNAPFDFAAYLNKLAPAPAIAYQLIPVDNDISGAAGRISSDVEAVYVLPLSSHRDPAGIQALLLSLAGKGLPVFSLMSSPMLELGAYAAFDAGDNLLKIPRRVALNILKISEGQPAAGLNVKMDSYAEHLMINMKTVRLCGHYPGWETLSKATLLNVAEVETGSRALTLRSAIAEGLQENLELLVAEREVNISEQEVNIAKSNYLPQIDASATALGIDENSVRNSFGTKGHLNFSARASLTQLILSEPALANISIQKLLLESRRQSLRQNELDVVQQVADAYLNILQAVVLVRLRNENVGVTRKNYDIAKAKEQVGYGGTSDVYRWESELALDNVDLNSARAQLQQSRFQLNMLLNRPVKESLQLADVSLADSVLSILDGRLLLHLNNPGDIELLADFLVQEAFNNLPEIRQVEASLAAQERSLLSQNRAFYLPQLVLSAEYDYPIDQVSYPDDVMPIKAKPTYNAVVAVQLPLFQGNFRRYQKEQTRAGILQWQGRMADLKNKLELQVRAGLETAGASFSNLALSRRAVEAARKNFESVQDAYRQGLLNVTSLIDAQNALLQTEINAITAEYTLIGDFLAVERSVGYYHFLALPQERDAFVQRFFEFITNKRK